jgi:hypothetical protein
MNLLIQLKQTTSVFLVALGLTCFGLSTTVRAVTPAPDGGYPGMNTVEGDNALLSLTIGTDNTAIAYQRSVTTQTASATRRSAMVRSLTTQAAAIQLLAKVRSLPTPRASTTRPTAFRRSEIVPPAQTTLRWATLLVSISRPAASTSILRL